MSLKNKIISWVLLGAFLQTGFSALKFETSASGEVGLSEEEFSYGDSEAIGLSETITEASYPELETENYTLIRVIKSGETRFAYYEHNETKAGVVVNLDETKKDEFEIMYRLPVLDNTGTNHILEHSVAHNMPYPNVDAYTCCNIILFQIRNIEMLKDKIFFDELKNPEFLKNRQIFETEKYNVYYEDLQERCNEDFINKYRFECKGSEHECFYGGIAEEITDATYENVCEAFNKYIHPSNCLIYIEGKNSEEMMQITHEKYFEGQGQRTAEFPCVETSDQDKDYYQFEIGTAEDFECEGCRYKHRATIIYDFGKQSVKAKYISKLNYWFGVLLDENIDLILALNQKGISRCKVRYDHQHKLNKILVLDLFTDHENAVEEYNLREVSSFVFEFIKAKLPDICPCCFDGGEMNKNQISGLIKRSFGKYSQPFSDEVFDIREDQINWESSLDEILSIIKDEDISTRIMSLTRGRGDGFYDKYWFSLPLKTRFERKTLLLEKLVGCCIVCPELGRTGIGYGCELCKGGDKEVYIGIGGDTRKLYEFSNKKFLKLLRNFEITEDAFDIILRTYEEEGMNFSDIEFKDIKKYFSSTKWNKLSCVYDAHVRRRYDNGTYRDFDSRATVTTCQNPELDVFWAQVLLDNVIYPGLKEKISHEDFFVNIYAEDEKIGFEIWCIDKTEIGKVKSYFNGIKPTYIKNFKEFKVTQEMIDKAAQKLGRNNKPSPEVFETQKKFWSKLTVKIK